MEMKLSSDLSRSDVKITHRDRVLVFNISPFERTELNDEVDRFKQINNYWAKMPIDEQDQIFTLYEKIWNVLDMADNIDQVTADLQPLVRDLLDKHHDLERVNNWCWFYSDLQIPYNIPDSLEFEEGGSSTEDKTYLKRDYKELVALSVVLRAMIPIWGEFIFRTKNECGSTYKEYFTLRLLNYSNIMNSAAVEKLTRYIMKQLPSDRATGGTTIGQISSDDFPYYMLARVMVRRLCLGDISGTNPNSTILTFVYKYIRQKNNGSRGSQRSGSTNFNDIIRDKFPESSGDSDDGDNKLSKLEGYKIQEELSRGDVQTIRYFSANVDYVLNSITPRIEPAILQQSLQGVAMFNSETVDPAQLALMQWVLSVSINPEGLATINRAGLPTIIAIAQAVLWQGGHKELAALCSAYPRQIDEHQILTVESRGRIPRELQEEIRRLFPFQRREGGKSRQPKVRNSCLVSIDKIADGLCAREWVLTIPDLWLAELGIDSHNRKFVAPFDIKVKLANLIISLVQRRAV